jgi:hypothetical protein
VKRSEVRPFTSFNHQRLKPATHFQGSRWWELVALIYALIRPRPGSSNAGARRGGWHPPRPEGRRGPPVQPSLARRLHSERANQRVCASPECGYSVALQRDRRPPQERRGGAVRKLASTRRAGCLVLRPCDAQGPAREGGRGRTASRFKSSNSACSAASSAAAAVPLYPTSLRSTTLHRRVSAPRPGAARRCCPSAHTPPSPMPARGVAVRMQADCRDSRPTKLSTTRRRVGTYAATMSGRGLHPNTKAHRQPSRYSPSASGLCWGN